MGLKMDFMIEMHETVHTDGEHDRYEVLIAAECSGYG